MRTIAVGLATFMTLASWGPAMGESSTEEIQDSEQPGSEIEIDMGGGGAQIHRKSGAPLFDVGENDEDDDIPLEPLPGPADPVDPDPIDEELPGEGPESLSGPDDDDPLPY